MSTKTCFALALALFSLKTLVTAQSLPASVFSCGETEMRAQYLSGNPEHQLRHQAFEKQVYDRLTQKAGKSGALFQAKSGAPFVLPVVVHIIHDGGVENISDARVQLAIDHLNEAYAAAGYYQLRGATENTQIQFCLASLAPDGTPTTGITRDQSALTDMTTPAQDLDVKDIRRWDPLHYINIWVVREIVSASLGPGVAGYAFFPSAHGMPEDGLVCEAQFFGASPAEDAVVIHEMGHYLGLYHTFEGGCPNANCLLDGDRICDTPPDQATQTACGYNSCSTDVAVGSPFTTDVSDMTENFMDYSPPACYYAFTPGQTARMQASIETTRASLLDSKGCGQPCTQPVTAGFSFPAGPLFAGQTINLTNQSMGATIFTWMVGGLTFSTQANPAYTFPAAGTYTFTLLATNGDANCKDKSVQTVTVTCPVMADFTASATLIEAGGSVSFTNTSSGATDYQWFVNGVLQGPGPTFNYTFSTPGDFNVVLEATNGFCTTQHSLFIKVKTPCNGGPCSEICDNGIDDDQDGYIDCYDSDCSCAGPTGCTIPIVEPDIDAKLAWESAATKVFTYTTPLVANLDPQRDSMPEIVCAVANTDLYNINLIYIFTGDGSNRNAPDQLPIPQFFGGFNSIAIGDLDKDKIPELVVVCKDERVRVYRNYDPVAAVAMQLWLTSDLPVGLAEAAPALADFDGDGFPEIYVGNAIFKLNLSNPAFPQLQRKTLDPFGPLGQASNFGLQGVSTAGDLLSRADCGGDPDCDGLELAAGTAIYSVDLDPTDGDGVELKIQRDLQTLAPPASWSDGLTSIADMDLDGIPDVVVSGTHGFGESGVYVWNKNGLVRFMPLFFPGGTGYEQSGGLPCIANVYDDRKMGAPRDFPEVMTASTSRLYALNLNAADISPTSPSWWTLPTSDLSGRTTASTFDFNGDGTPEIVYRDQTDLSILYGGNAPFPAGVNAQQAWYATPSFSGTYGESPIVADVDNDGFAEIAVTSAVANLSYLGRLRIYKHNAFPWPAARSVWNQVNYHVTNVNDDASIPADMQKHWLEFPGPGGGKWPLNNFLGQTGNPHAPVNPGTPVPDAAAALESVDCEDGMLAFHLRVCNTGSAALPAGTPIRFYSSDPTATMASLLSTIAGTSTAVAKDSCLSMTILLPLPPSGSQVFGIVNDDGSLPPPFDLVSGFPSTNQFECDYKNNLFKYDFSISTPALQLGNDIQLCQNSVVQLSAGAGFTQYRWQDGSIDSVFTAYQPGKYWVDVWNECGQKQSDTLRIEVSPQLSFELGADKKICPGDSLQLAVASPNATISWSANLNDAICDNCPSIWIKPTQSTLYQATGVVGNCIFSDSIRIDIAPGIQLDLQTTGGNCFGDPGLINSAASGGIPPFAYLWSDGSTLPDLAGAAPGTYSVTVTDALGCKIIRSDSVASAAALQVAATETAPKCSGENSGDIDLTVSGGSAPFQYAWSVQGAGSVSAIQNLPSGNYLVTITDAHGCSTTAQYALQDPPALSLSAAETAPKCFGEDSGDIGLTVSGGTSPFQYDWSIPGAGNVSSVQNLPAGNYEVTVSDLNGCATIAQYALQDPPALALTAVETAPKCFGENSGDIDLTVSGGISPFQYAWSPPGTGNVPNLQQLPAGDYLVTVTDANGCSSTAQYTLQDPPALSITAAETDPKCFGENSGEIGLTVSGGTSPFQYAWSVPGTGSVSTVQNLPAGDYPVTVTDANACTSTAQFSLQDPPVLSLTAAETAPKCFGENSGEIGLTVSGGTSPFQYAWSVAGVGSVPTVQNLPAGDYLVTVTDANGCSSTAQYTLQDPPALSLTAAATDPKCFGENSGEIGLTVTGGTSPFGYAWSVPGAGSVSTVQNLPAGDYPVTVTDANGCSATAQYTLQDPPALTISAMETGPKCFGESSGDIGLTVTGGTSPFLYAWSIPGAGSMPDVSDLPAGTYQVTVSDVNGCSTSAQYTLQEPLLLTVKADGTPPKCFGEDSGAIVLTASGGTAPFQYAWSVPGAGNVAGIQKLPSGTYQFTVSDANGCFTNSEYLLQDPPTLTVTAAQQDPKCFGENSGSLGLSVAGGTAPYQYAWSVPGAGNVPDVQQLPAGDYLVTVSDANGCSIIAQYVLQEPPGLSVTAVESDPKCFGENSGAIGLSVSGGTSPFQYAWSVPGAGNAPGVQQLPAGNYPVTVTDANGCSTTAQYALQDPPGISITAVEHDPKCFGENSGDIGLSVAGGTAPFQYAWSVPGTSSTPDVQHLPAGNYQVTVSDANGCSTVAQYALADPPGLSITAVENDPKCFGEDSGDIGLTIDGGTAPFQYAWSVPGAGDVPEVQHLPAGNYQVTVSDANGCSTTGQLELDNPPALEVELTVSDSIIEAGSFVVLTAETMQGPAGPITYEWQPSDLFDAPYESSEKVFPAESGIFSVKVTDGNGCAASDQQLVRIREVDVYVPNTFLPGSSQNGVFTVFGGASLQSVRWMRIYDRWGELVFESLNFAPNDLSAGWDGTFRNKPAPVGVYVYSIGVEFSNGGTKEIKGDVTIVR